jgi:hypothetical protein
MGGKVTGKALQDNDDETSDFEQVQNPPRQQVDDIIDEYKEEATRRDTTPCATIYKYDDNRNGQDRQFCGYFKGSDIPNRHTIGLTYGSGRYAILLNQPKGTAAKGQSTTLVFRIHATYDGLKAAADAEKYAAQNPNGTPGNQHPAAPQRDTTAQSFQMVKEILSLMLPVMRANQAAAIPAASARQEGPREIADQYKMMRDLLRENLMDTANTYNEFRARLANAEDIADAEIDDPTQQQEGGLLEKIIALIEPFFGLIASKSPAAQLAATSLKAAPQFVEVLNDPTLCRMIVTHFDKTKGRARADMALKNIGIDRAHLFGPSATELAAKTAQKPSTQPGK